MRDARGRTLDLSTVPQRVVSLVPSLTETLFDLGVGQTVIGITDFCIFPPDLDLPRVGGTKNPRINAIRELRPHLVHMNLEENLAHHAAAIETFAPVFVSDPKSVTDVVTLLRILGEIHRCHERAEEWAEAISGPNGQGRRPFTFAVPIWKSPWMWCGGDTYVSNLIETSGGRNVLHDERRYPAHSVEEIAALRPEIVFLPDEPFAFTAADAGAFRAHAHVIGPFPGHLITWHGTRTLLGLRFLRELRLE